jgi:hypothetical protein
MPLIAFRQFPKLLMLVAMLCVSGAMLLAQTESARISGLVTDASGAVVENADIMLQNIEQGTSSTVTTNHAGIFVLASVRPGQYRISVRKFGFRQVDVVGVIVNVQDRIEENFRLQPGSVSESITVTGGAPIINAEDATVSTVVDRNFAENLPMNGRTLQTLIQLTPGVVALPVSASEPGQFSISGQRPNSNYWTVDGVSANVEVSANGSSAGMAGSFGAVSLQGGTNSLVSVDAMQEFRIQTSTYAPEFGRTPGGQISIVTRSGADQFHGTAFDYFRNDVLDANDWFADQKGLQKPEERQNDFGGIFSGPIVKDRTFFFFSYEGLRLRLPQALVTTVPSLSARSSAVSVMQPFFNAFPLPTGPDNPDGSAAYNATFSTPSSLDAASLRIDHRWSRALSMFGRYNYSPSELSQRSPFNYAASAIDNARIVTQTTTAGATWAISPLVVNDLRFNYSRVTGSSRISMDDFGGAVTFSSVPNFPSPYTLENARFSLEMFSLPRGSIGSGLIQNNLQRQINVVDSLAIQKGSHSLKFGTDFRRLTPRADSSPYFPQVNFLDVSSAESNSVFFDVVAKSESVTMLFRNLGFFGQDTWRLRSRLTLTYGLRWDLDFSPQSLGGANLLAMTGDPNNFSSITLAPNGTPVFKTTYTNIAPRVGVAYELAPGTVIRGGAGVFYDLASQEVGNYVSNREYPFGASRLDFPGTFPIVQPDPPPVSVADIGPQGSTPFRAFDPHLKSPYTLEWNIAVEHAFGSQQRLSASYLGAAGRRLLQSEFVFTPNNPNFNSMSIGRNTGTSDYDALQLQFERRLSHGLQALAGYAWAHSIDTGSLGIGSLSDLFSPSAGSNRGPSNFDIRHALSAGLTYDVPAPKINRFMSAFLRNWGVESVVEANSALPVDANYIGFVSAFQAETPIRPDVTPGIPLYLYGSQFAGGKVINNTPGAITCSDGSPSIGPFCPPPLDANGKPTRQGNLSRNALRGFGLFQWDLGIHRQFPIHDSVTLQFRAEMFNLLNHPNFGAPVGNLSESDFGAATAMLGKSMAGAGNSIGAGGLSPLYQVGGPRSVQLALKLQF